MKSASYGRLLFWSLMISLMLTTSTALDTVTPIQSLHDGKTLVSKGGNFELGFFSPGSSTRRYVGIWFKNISVMTYVWVANRESPLLDSFGVLQMTNQSVLTLVNSTGGVVWSSNTSRSVSNPVAQLLDSGNLVVRDPKDDNLDNILWQSFDYPCYTLLSEMKLGKNFVTGLDRFLISWKSSDDPSPGSYTYRIDPTGYPQPFLLKDNVVQFRDGPWNGLWFSSTTRLPTFTPNEVEFVLNNKEMYYVHGNFSHITNRVLDPSGHINFQQWIDHTQTWGTCFLKPEDSCDIYGVCGAFSSCNFANDPQCQCMNGFVPRSITNWNAGNWRDGCVRSAPLNCSGSHGFIKYPNVKLPDTRYSWCFGVETVGGLERSPPKIWIRLR